MKRSSEILGAPQVDDIAKTDDFESFNVQENDPFRGEFNLLANLVS